ncbi:MAG: AAA family ATPase [Rubrivivax sp.]
MSADPAPLAFGEFRLDPVNALLQRGAERLELPPKVFALLCHLAARPGQLVTKDELLDAVWGRRFVSESVLKTAVNTLRGALGDDPRTPRFVETVPRRGYRFLAVPAAAAAPAPARVEDAPPLWVARDAAEARLQEALAAVQAGGRQLVLLGGEAGIGKTTLVDRFCRAVSGSVALASGQCVEQVGGGEPLLPLLDALAALARGPEGALWVQAMRQCAPSWLARLPWLQPGGDAAPAPAAGEPERMLREFGALLDLRTPQRPLVLVVEDLHWSDHATVQLLGYLARRRGPARWLLLASYRPTEAALADHPLMALRLELRAQRLAAEVALDAFTEREVDGYLERRFAPAAVQDRAALARALQAHTEGLPLFVAAVVDELLQTGELAERGGAGWQLAADAWRRLAVPETIAGLVERQIARLPGPLRALLEAASVLGAEFAHDVLAALLDEPADALRARCDGLARRAEWLASAGMAERPGGRLAFRYAFRHALYQRVFYERAEPAQRLQHHRAAAQALLALAGHDDDHHAAELALHFERARDIATAAGALVPQLAAEARRWRLAAARAAQALQAPADALAHYARVLEGAPEAAEAAAVLVERAELLRVTGQGEAALAEARRAIDLAQAAGDAAAAGRGAARARAHRGALRPHPRRAGGCGGAAGLASAAPTRAAWPCCRCRPKGCAATAGSKRPTRCSKRRCRPMLPPAARNARRCWPSAWTCTSSAARWPRAWRWPPKRASSTNARASRRARRACSSASAPSRRRSNGAPTPKPRCWTRASGWRACTTSTASAAPSSTWPSCTPTPATPGARWRCWRKAGRSRPASRARSRNVPSSTASTTATTSKASSARPSPMPSACWPPPPACSRCTGAWAPPSAWPTCSSTWANSTPRAACSTTRWRRCTNAANAACTRAPCCAWPGPRCAAATPRARWPRWRPRAPKGPSNTWRTTPASTACRPRRSWPRATPPARSPRWRATPARRRSRSGRSCWHLRPQARGAPEDIEPALARRRAGPPAAGAGRAAPAGRAGARAARRRPQRGGGGARGAPRRRARTHRRLARRSAGASARAARGGRAAGLNQNSSVHTASAVSTKPSVTA